MDYDFDDIDDDELMKVLDESEKNLAQPCHSTSTKIPANVPYLSKPTEEALQVLRQYFGHNDFRSSQWEIIRSVLYDKRDQLVIMATGCGKSLCYQFPSLLSPAITFVISPLISLMEDQVRALNVVGIDSCLLGSAQRDKSTYLKVKEGKFKIVYITPEYAETETGHDLIQTISSTLGVAVIAVDEAHCISQWGHDFRSSYRKMGDLRKKFSSIPFMAMTATATPTVRDDIVKNLKLSNPAITCTTFDRPNLYLEVFRKEGGVFGDLKRFMKFSDDGKAHFNGSTIIYCPTRKQTEEVCMLLENAHVIVEMYHAGLNPTLKTMAHKKFSNDECEVIVATVAFGMGIDKPDVRRVIHYGASKDIESYYQEIGRAGRDGLPSTCSILYNNRDFLLNNFLLKDVKNEKFREYKASMQKKMQDYLTTSKCRRQFLLSHFEGGHTVAETQGNTFNPNCCDNCKREYENANKVANQVNNRLVSIPSSASAKDFEKQALICLSIVQALKGRYGANLIVQAIQGSHNKKVPASVYTHKYFGKGSDISDKWWKAFVPALVTEGLLKQVTSTEHYGCTLSLSDKGRLFLMSREGNKSRPFPMQPTNEMLQVEADLEARLASRENVRIERTKSSASSNIEKRILPARKVREYISLNDSASTANETSAFIGNTDLERQLLAQLTAKRSVLSRDAEIPPYMVATNRALLELAQIRPATLTGLARVEDFPQARVDRFGRAFLQTVDQFCKEHTQLKRDNFGKEDATPNMKQLPPEDQLKLLHLSLTIQESYKMMVLLKLSLSDIATNRQLADSTIGSHIGEAIKVGLPVNLDSLQITKEIRDKVLRAIRGSELCSDISRISPIKELLGNDVSWVQLKICLGLLEYEYGLSKTLEEYPMKKNLTETEPAQSSKETKIDKNLPASSISNEKNNSEPISFPPKRKIPEWLSQSSFAETKKPKSSVFK